MRKPTYGSNADVQNGEAGGDSIVIDGIITRTVGSIDELCDLLEPTYTTIDLTSDEPEITTTTPQATHNGSPAPRARG